MVKKHWNEGEAKFSQMLWLGENIDTPYGKGTILSLSDKSFVVVLDKKGGSVTITYDRIDKFIEKQWMEKHKV
jgi:hypothetical protein